MWELEYNGTRSSFADRGLSEVSLTRTSCGEDRLTFSAGEAFDAPLKFEYGSTITVWRSGVRYFTGKIITTPRSGAPTFERHAYTACSPWIDLTKVPFEQFWHQDDGELASTIVILGKTKEDVRMTCGQQIKEILDHAISQGAALSYNSADLDALDITPPESQETDIACSESLLRMLNWHKDFTSFFDYADAVPVLRFSKRSTAAAISFNCSQGAPAEEINIIRRDDLKIRGCTINYSITSTVNGRSVYSLRTETAGEKSGLGVLKNTVELEGYSVDRLTQRIKTTTCPKDTGIGFYLAGKTPWLFAPEVESYTWSDFEAKPPEEMPDILTEGTCQDWMTGVLSGTGTLSATAKVIFKNGDVKSIKVSCSETFTNAQTKTYRKSENYVSGESMPVKLAEKIYNQFTEYHYQGSFSLLEVEVSGSARPGMVLNLTGGLAEWASMRAQIQQVAEDLDEGRTVISFGPPDHLSAQDFVELLRVNRIRKKSEYSRVRATGESNTSSSVELSGAAPNTDSVSGQVGASRTVVENAAKTRKIDLNPDMATWGKGKALVISDNEASTYWGSTMPPIGANDLEYMVLQIQIATPEATEENPNPAPEKTPVWGWVRAVNPIVG
jgi:hypothetical protein